MQRIKIIVKNLIKSFIFILYLVILLALTFGGREPEPERMAWLSLFGSFQRAWNEQHNFIFWGIVVNFLMMLPLGLLLPWGSRSFGFLKTVFTAACLSFLIECAQYITRLGYFDVDDLITNVWGAAAGAGFCLSIKELAAAVRKDMRPRWGRIAAGLIPFLLFLCFFGYFFARIESNL